MYAHKYEDFAAVVQPFFSGARADNLTVDFLSDVSSFDDTFSFITLTILLSHTS